VVDLFSSHSSAYTTIGKSAYNHYPPLHLGYPGDLYIQGSSSSLWYKVDKEHPLWNDESFGWVRVPGDLGLDHHIRIKHPLHHFHLVA
jgi:hypothetical protein